MRFDTVTVDRPVNDVPEIRGVEPFDVFFRREYRPVLGLAVVLSGSVPAAEEITQDAFEAALRHWDAVASLDRPGAWVRRVVARRSVSAYRRRLAEAKALLRMGRPSAASDVALDSYTDVRAAIRRLPRRQAQVIALVYFDDLPRREVAEVLACSEETVKTHLERARRTLEGWLA